MQYGLGACLLPLLILFGSSASAAEPAITIERLLGDGWEIAGFAGNLDVRTALILFRKPGVTHLVQCSTLFDVTRSQRIVVNCYELR